MKNRLSIVISVFCMTVFVVIASVISVSANNKKPKTVLLKEYNGQIALFENDKVVEIYDEIVISVLPDTDRELLKKGIVIENQEQLTSIIEDYDG